MTLRYIIAIVLILSAGTHLFAQSKDPLVDSFLQKRKSIFSGEYIYTHTIKHLHHDEVRSSRLRVRFIDIKYKDLVLTAFITENLTHGSSIIYNLDSTYRFFPDKEWRTVSKSNPGLNGLTFYPPLERDNPSYYSLSRGSAKNVEARDTLYNQNEARVYRRQSIVYDSSQYTIITDIFNRKDVLPVFNSHYAETQGDTEYATYRLEECRFNLFDSASFFSMLSDSIKDLVATCPRTAENTPRNAPDPLLDTAAPDFCYPTFGGDSVRLSTILQARKVVILDFWYTSCQWCLLAMPKLVSLYKKYKPHGLEILGINPFDRKYGTLSWVAKKLDISYPIVLGDTNVIKNYGFSGYPCLFVINGDGKIIDRIDGYSPEMESYLTDVIEKCLARKED